MTAAARAHQAPCAPVPGIRQRLWRGIVLPLVALLLACPGAAAQERSFLPGATWGVILPDGFEMTEYPVPLFSHPDRAYIVIEELFELDNPEGLGPAGSILGEGAQAIRVEGQEDLTIEGRSVQLWTARNVSTGAWTFIAFAFGPQSIGSVTAVITAESSIDPQVMRAALLSAAPREISDAERLATFPVRLTDVAGFRLARFSHDRLLMTEDGLYTDADRYPRSFVAVTAQPRAPGQRIQLIETENDLRALARQRFPNGRHLGSDVIRTQHGQALATRFAFTQPGGTAFLGEMVFFMSSCCAVLNVAAWPEGRDDMPERFRQIWNGVGNRR